MINKYLKRLKNTVCVLFLGLLMIGFSSSVVHGQTDTHAKIKSLFIYNFAKYVEWPGKMKEGDFVIGILGDHPTLHNELSKMAQTKTRGNQSFKIKNYKSADEVYKCHILFIEAGKSDQLQDVINHRSGKNTLIVGDGSGLAKQGAGISFYEAQSKQKMEVNPDNLEKYNLKISSQLVALATVVK